MPYEQVYMCGVSAAADLPRMTAVSLTIVEPVDKGFRGIGVYL